MLKFPFEASFEDLQTNPDAYVASVFSCLESEFLLMPKGPGFIDYPVFEQGYEALKQASSGFAAMSEDILYPAVLKAPISLVVLRAMLGFTPPEWAYITSRRSGVEIPQGFARTLDRKVRMAPLKPMSVERASEVRLRALIKAACDLLASGAPEVEPVRLHRLDKADTKSGIQDIKALAGIGVPYAMLLYERFLGGGRSPATAIQ